MSLPVWDGVARLAECHEVFVWDVGRSWRCVDVLWDDLRWDVDDALSKAPRRVRIMRTWRLCEGPWLVGEPCDASGSASPSAHGVRSVPFMRGSEVRLRLAAADVLDPA